MKNILTITITLLSFSLFAQVPQGIGYQGVATDANGIELSNQAINIRASILSGSSTGSVIWQETHSISTDTFGLFTIYIGQGLSTGSGAQNSFVDIEWGVNTHYLKIEMDINAGNNYSFMGVNQMMSVPYALYAESSNIDYDSISNYLSADSTFITNINGGSTTINYDSLANLISADSTFITNVGGGIGSSGCDYKFPEGLDGQTVFSEVSVTNQYVVPLDKRLYLLSWKGPNPVIQGLECDFVKSMPLILNSGDILTNDALSTSSAFSGLLVDEQSDLLAITVEITDFIPYQVPNGKKLVILNYINGSIRLEGSFDFSSDPSLGLPLIINSGTSIENANNFDGVKLNGYLVDENYFAGCGGTGGGSSSVTIDYDSLASLISSDTTFITNVGGGVGGVGCDWRFPDGLGGDPVIFMGYYNDYTVPNGKTLYITNPFVSSNTTITIDDIDIGSMFNINSGHSVYNPIVANEGQIVGGQGNFYGLLYENSVIDAISFSFSTNPTVPNNGTSQTYTVPSAKTLYILHQFNDGGAELFIDGTALISGANRTNNDSYSLGIPIKVKSGQVLSGNLYTTFNGYLVDDNYFANCGGAGGGSSSVTIDYDSLASLISSDTTFITNVGGGIGGGGCDILFPEGIDGEAISFKVNSSNKYTVPAGKRLYVTNNYGTGTYFNIVGVGNISYETNHERSHSLAMPIILNSGEQLESSNNNWVTVNGILVDENPSVQAISVKVNSSNKYTVPAGKRLYVTNNYGTGTYFNIVGVGNISYETNHERSHSLAMPVILNSGEQLESGNNNWVTVNGYLVDEDYFAGCGGVGGGNSSVTIDYDSLASLISADSTFITNVGGGIGGDGCDYAFPEGLDGDRMIINLGNGNYTVPSGKKLYMTNVKAYNLGGTYTMQINNNLFDLGSVHPIIATSGDNISVNNYSPNGSNSQVTIFGFLIDDPSNVERMIINLGNGSYTVPSGKKLYMTNVKAYNLGGTYTMQINNDLFDVGSQHPVIASSGDNISVNNYSPNGSNSQVTVFGYLADENYFAGCGGGGGGGSSVTIDYDSLASLISSDTTFITNVGGGIGGGCDYNFPSGLDGQSIIHDLTSSNYTVPSGKNLYITHSSYESSSTWITVNGYEIIRPIESPTHSRMSPFIASPGDVISFGGGAPNFVHFSGLLIDIEPQIIPIIHDLTSSNYTVPSGKNLYITHSSYESSSTWITVNGYEIIRPIESPTHFRTSPFIASPGDVISFGGGVPNFVHLAGYLADENYFAGCGGGGSSGSTSTNQNVNSINPYHPEGSSNLQYIRVNTPYTVPAGKTFYLSTEQNNLYLNNVGNVVEVIEEFPIPIQESSVLTWSGGGSLTIGGYLIDKGFEVVNYLGNNTSYTVPNNYHLYILGRADWITVNGTSLDTDIIVPIVLQPGDIVSSQKGFNALLIPN